MMFHRRMASPTFLSKPIKTLFSSTTLQNVQTRAECSACRYVSSCEGVWANYLRRYGWNEMQPVSRPEPKAAE